MFSNHCKIILRESIPVLLNEGLKVVFESSVYGILLKTCLYFIKYFIKVSYISEK